MFQVKPLTRVQSVQFSVTPMKRKTSAQVVRDRANEIAALCRQGKTYAQAVREFDAKARRK
jgi:membrane protein YdbS with pleckstrin-like domain